MSLAQVPIGKENIDMRRQDRDASFITHQVKIRLRPGVTAKEIAQAVGMTKARVLGIIRRRHWRLPVDAHRRRT